MSSFNKQVLGSVKKIPKGRITSYKIIAKVIGRPKAFRAIGNALNKNKELIRIPCHRVIKSDGTIGGYVKGPDKKKKLLQKEGVVIKNNKVVNFKKIIFKF